MKRLLIIAAVLLLGAATCGTDDPDDATSDVPGLDLSQLEDLVDEATGETSGDNDSADDPSSGAGSTDFQTIWPIPPFGGASLQQGFGEYSFVDSGSVTNENVTFQMTETDRDAVVSFYQDILVDMGYEVGPPFELGGSIALNVSMSGDPNISAVVQVGPASPTDPTIIVHQNRTILTESSSDAPPDPDTGESSTDDE